MIIKSPFKVKPLAEAEPRELLKLTLASGVMTVTVLAKSASECRLGVLGSQADEITPFSFFDRRFEGSESCVSYGSEWILEALDGPETYIGNNGHRHEQGVLHIEGDNPVLIFYPTTTGRIDEFYFDLREWSIINSLSQRAVPASGWRIWTSEVDYARQWAQPLLAFP